LAENGNGGRKEKGKAGGFVTLNEKTRTDIYRCMRLICDSLLDRDLAIDLANRVTDEFLGKLVDLDWDNMMRLFKEYLGAYVRNTRIASKPNMRVHPGVLSTYLARRRTTDVGGFEVPELVVKKCQYTSEGILVEPFRPPCEVDVLVLVVEPSDNPDPSFHDTQVFQIRSTVVFRCPECESQNHLNYVLAKYDFAAHDYQHFMSKPPTCSRGHAFYVDKTLYSMHLKEPQAL